MTKRLLINAGLFGAAALSLAACGDGDGNASSGSAQFQFGQFFSQVFGSGPDLTAEPVSVQNASLPPVSLTAEPVPVQ